MLVKGIGDGIGFRLDEITDGMANYIHNVIYKNNDYYMINCYKNRCRYLAFNQIGKVKINQEWISEETKKCELEFHAENGEFLAVIEEVPVEWVHKEYHLDYDACQNKTQESFDNFFSSMPKIPEEYKETAKLAAYINWTSIVKKYGLLTRDAMYMSKNWMNRVWSWDHCFNAMALSHGYPEEAWNQFMLIFDYQDKTGLIPDSVNDSSVEYSFSKPPIHGWAFSKMMELMNFTEEQFKKAYNKLSKWTSWWFEYRDNDNDGICEYYHGNDSGWDNSSAFAKLPPVETPDLSAFLIIQMDVLSRIAHKLGDNKGMETWRKKADLILNAMLEHCFDGVKPKSVRMGTHEVIKNESLLMYVPVVLGKRLPEEYRNHMINILKSEKFYTGLGFATQATSSHEYVSDGYWRGPIWAPSSMIIIDGLFQSGEIEFARQASRAFCDLVRKKGCAENFDALKGTALRDKAYTETASVFLIIANMLKEENYIK